MWSGTEYSGVGVDWCRGTLVWGCSVIPECRVGGQSSDVCSSKVSDVALSYISFGKCVMKFCKRAVGSANIC